MARIALIVPTLETGGGVPAVGRFLRDVARDRNRFEIRLVSLASAACDSMNVRLAVPPSWWRGAGSRTGTWEGLPFVHVGAVCGALEFQRYRSRQALTDAVAGCDLVQVVSGSPAWANAVLGIGVPVSLHVATRARVERRLRDAHPQGMLGWWRKAMTEVTDRIDDRALCRVDAVQVMNPYMLDYARNLNEGRDVDIRYAPPGVDAALFHPLVARAPSRDRYILCVARLDDPRKNIGLLLEAYARLPAAAKAKTRLVLAGSSGPPPAFWARAEQLGLRDRVEYIARPDREALVRLYQGASVFALPSDEEGFGVVLLEAMACGVPVVSTRSGGPDGIITDGKDGYLVALDDAAQMADRIGGLLLDPVMNFAMGREARRTIEARYADHVAGEAFVDVWDRLLTKAGKA